MGLKSYEDGGEVQEQTRDSQFDPGDQQGGAIPDAADQYIGQSRSGVAPPHQALRNIAQAAIRYLHGDGAAPPQMVKQAESQVDPQGQMDPNQRTVEGIKVAADQGGPDAGFAFIQAHRQMYNAKNAFARAALNGGQGKPPDINAAVNAANQAYYHMPDGQSVQFTSNGDAVTATVNGQHFRLTPQQFDQWLDVGGAGQFDKVYETGAAKVLASLATPQQGAIPETNQLPATDSSDMRAFAAPDVAAQNPQKYRAVPSNYRSPDIPSTGFDPQMEERSRRIFPGNEAARVQWLQGQEAREAELENKVNVEKTKGEALKSIWNTRTSSNERVADTRAKAYVTAADMKSQATRDAAAERLQAAAMRTRDTAMIAEGKSLSAQVMANQVDQKRLEQFQQRMQMFEQQNGGTPTPAAPAGTGPRRVRGPDGKIYIQQ